MLKHDRNRIFIVSHRPGNEIATFLRIITLLREEVFKRERRQKKHLSYLDTAEISKLHLIYCAVNGPNLGKYLTKTFDCENGVTSRMFFLFFCFIFNLCNANVQCS